MADSTFDAAIFEPDAALNEKRDAAVLGSCGDRVVSPALGEHCDDGNAVDDDGCNDDCHASARLLWAHDHEENVFPTTMAVDAAGAIAVAGWEVQSGATSDLWLRKYASDGSPAWTRAQTLDVGQAEGATAIAFAPGGDVVVLGSTQVLGNTAPAGLVLMKHAGADGARRWPAPVRAMAGEEHVGRTLLVGPNQQIYTFATFRRDSRLDVWLQLFDSSGSAVWPSPIERNEGLGEFPGAFWLASDNTLRAYWTATPSAPMDLVLADISIADGSLTTRHAPLSTLRISNQVYFAVDGQGGVVVCANVLMGQVRALWMQKFSSEGEPVWPEEVLETRDDSLQCAGVALAPDGNIAVTAYAGSSAPRVWLRLYSADGRPRWPMPIVYDGGYEAIPAGVGFDGDGNVIAAGVRRTVESYSFLWLAKYAR